MCYKAVTLINRGNKVILTWQTHWEQRDPYAKNYKSKRVVRQAIQSRVQNQEISPNRQSNPEHKTKIVNRRTMHIIQHQDKIKQRENIYSFRPGKQYFRRNTGKSCSVGESNHVTGTEDRIQLEISGRKSDHLVKLIWQGCMIQHWSAVVGWLTEFLHWQHPKFLHCVFTTCPLLEYQILQSRKTMEVNKGASWCHRRTFNIWRTFVSQNVICGGRCFRL